MLSEELLDKQIKHYNQTLLMDRCLLILAITMIGVSASLAIIASNIEQKPVYKQYTGELTYIKRVAEDEMVLEFNKNQTIITLHFTGHGPKLYVGEKYRLTCRLQSPIPEFVSCYQEH